MADQTMASLAQSLAANQVGGNPHTSTFSGIMEWLKVTHGLMIEGF